MTEALKLNSFRELSHNDMEQVNGGFGVVMTVAAVAILVTFYVAPAAVAVGSVVVKEYKKAAEEGARRGTVDAYTDYNYYNK